MRPFPSFVRRGWGGRGNGLLPHLASPYKGEERRRAGLALAGEDVVAQVPEIGRLELRGVLPQVFAAG